MYKVETERGEESFKEQRCFAGGRGSGQARAARQAGTALQAGKQASAKWLLRLHSPQNQIQKLTMKLIISRAGAGAGDFKAELKFEQSQNEPFQWRRSKTTRTFYAGNVSKSQGRCR